MRPTFDEAMRAAAATFSKDLADYVKGQRLRIRRAARGAVSEARDAYSRPLVFLMAAVGFLLLIACANVANLLLAQAVDRRGEVGIRLALGATVPRLIALLLVESVLLALLGGALGVLLAAWGIDAVAPLLPHEGGTLQVFPRIDTRVLAFTTSVCFATTIVFGLAPALRATRVDLAVTLRRAASRQSTGQKSRLMGGLVALQLAVCLVILSAAGLLGRSLAKMGGESIGIQRERLLMFTVDPGLAGYRQPQLQQFYADLLDRLRALPGVTSATVSMFAIPGDSGWQTLIDVPGFQARSMEDRQVGRNVTGPEFARTPGLTLAQGRDVSTGDTEEAPRIAVVNESFVRGYLPDASPLGREFTFSDAPDRRYRIVGVVKDARDRGVHAVPPRMVYTSFLQDNRIGSMVVTLATNRRPGDVLPEALGAARAFDASAPISRAQTVDTLVRDQLRPERLLSAVATLFGATALLLACVGLYGLVSHAVAQRTGEIGIRMVLGASRAQVMRLVLRDALMLVFAGLVVGLMASASLMQLMTSLLYGLSPRDPGTLLAATCLLLGVALLAGYVPARRASRLNAATALRWE